MSVLIASLMLATSFVTPSPERDMTMFLEFIAAQKVCPAISIDLSGTGDQIVKLREALHWKPTQVYEARQAQDRIAEFHSGYDKEKWCDQVRGHLEAYDPAYLRKVGVID